MKRHYYGVSSKYAYHKWEDVVYKFDSRAEAEKWLHSEEYDFCHRELITRTNAEKIIGRTAVREMPCGVGVRRAN